jgi:hypothetical protein
VLIQATLLNNFKLEMSVINFQRYLRYPADNELQIFYMNEQNFEMLFFDLGDYYLPINKCIGKFSFFVILIWSNVKIGSCLKTSVRDGTFMIILIDFCTQLLRGE